MFLEVGDRLSGEGILTGKYLGVEDCHGKTFHKVYDNVKQVTLFIPMGQEGKLRKLPTAATIQKNLKIFNNGDTIDEQEIENSRYKYYKEKISKVKFTKTLEVFHDLCVLHKEKRITPSERKLMGSLKEKLVAEVAYVLDEDLKAVESLLSLQEDAQTLQ